MQRIDEVPSLPARPHDGHKGTFGRVLLIAGSRGMSGAAILSGTSALRSGAGLVYIALPEGILPIVAGFEPSYLTIPLNEDESGKMSEVALHELQVRMTQMDAGAIGPGLGQSDELQVVVSELYRTTSQPLVIDADGLNLLARCPAQLSQHDGPRVLTPHPGEFSRLTGTDIASDPPGREQAAVHFAADNQVVLVLKGPGTVITDGKRIAVSQLGTNALATGGTGDVLTGIITSLIGQGMEPFDAAHLGVHVHSLAGLMVAERLSSRGTIASDLLFELCNVWMNLEHE